jgi:hypothetical protein
MIKKKLDKDLIFFLKSRYDLFIINGQIFEKNEAIIQIFVETKIESVQNNNIVEEDKIFLFKSSFKVNKATKKEILAKNLLFDDNNPNIALGIKLLDSAIPHTLILENLILCGTLYGWYSVDLTSDIEKYYENLKIFNTPC